MRLFIAVDFPQNIKNEIHDISRRLREHCVSGNFSHRENLHLTLLFIGEVSPKQTAMIKKAMEDIRFDGLQIQINGFGKFRRGDENIYWLGLKNNPALASLADSIKKAAGNVVETEDKKDFSPHITIARRAVPKHGFNEKAFSANIPKTVFTVDFISLMKSERINGKLTYTEIYRKNAAF